MSIEHPRDFPQPTVNQAIKILDTFRDYCQRQYIAFYYAQAGMDYLRERDNPAPTNNPNNPNPRYSFGTQVPDGPQSPGSSTIAVINQSDLYEALKPDGEFQNQYANALVVFIYQLWSDNFRKKIADVLSILRDGVECDLMEDIRKIRNRIIHHQSDIPQNLPNKLKILSHIWNIEPGELRISSNMIRSLMEQINAIRVKIT